MCSLVSISNATAPPIFIIISPELESHPAAPTDVAGRADLLLNTQHVVKKAKATSRRRGPMMMGGLLLGRRVPNAKAPTRVMLTPASVTHSPQAQHSAGDGRLCGGRVARFLGSLV